jgi:hypothetical protein
MPGLKVEIAPVAEPVDLDMLKNHMHVDVTTDDEIIGVYLQSVRTKVEGFLGRSLITKGYVQSFDHFPRAHGHNEHGSDGRGNQSFYRGHHRHHLEIKLGRSPLVAVSRVEYLDPNGVLQTMLPRIDMPWDGGVEFLLGQKIIDLNGNIQEVTEVSDADEDGSSQSGDTVPTWPTSSGDTVDDGGLTWTCRGPAPVGDFIVDCRSEPGRIYPNINTNNYFWPYTQRVPNAVRVHFTAGYGDDPASIPGIFRTAIMIYVKGLYDFRDPFLTSPGAKPQEMPSHLRDMLWEDRILDFNPTEG